MQRMIGFFRPTLVLGGREQNRFAGAAGLQLRLLLGSDEGEVQSH
jgi:hypothetical protein